jgi:hypothetical protein
VLACLGAIAAVYAVSVSFAFVNWDDDLYVYRNPLVVDPARTTLRELLTTPALGYPAPLTVVSYRLEHALVGLSPWLYHLDNVLLHLTVCWLVLRVARALGASAFGESVAALAFGLHPVAVEPVAWVTGRKELFAALFVVAAAWALVAPPARAASPEPARRRGARAAVVVAGATLLGGLAKPVALFLPLLAAAWTRSVRRASWREALRTAAPAGIMALPLFALALAGQRRVGAIAAARSIGAVAREVWYALGYHLGLVLLVQSPSAKHLVPRPAPFDARVDLLPIVAGAGLVLALRFVDARRRAVVRAGLVFAALAYVPSSGLIPLVRYVADSYVYLPLAGLAWTAAALGEQAADALAARARAARMAFYGAVGLCVAGLAAVSVGRLATWRDGVALWTDVAATQPPSPNVCRLLGNAYNEAGASERALRQYRACVATFGPELFETNIAITLFKLGRRQEARAAFAAVLAKRPGDATARKYLALLDAAGGR